MDNYIEADKTKKFFVWINPKDIYAHHNANIGSFVSVENKADNLMFLPNANFSGYISPFQGNLLRSYLAEYKLETERKQSFENYPSRLVSNFLFETEKDAKLYLETHSSHVGDRVLTVAKTVGAYRYSKHDLSWIDFLRSPIISDEEVTNNMVISYWKGESVKDFKIPLADKTIFASAESIMEVLFIGRIDFEK